jgi:hypothetical protein
MLYDPARHEPLQELQWDDGAAALMIARIVRDTEARFSPDHHWPIHPLDADDGRMDPAFNLYFGASGVIWRCAIFSRRRGVAHALVRRARGCAAAANRAWLASEGAADRDAASLLMGDTGILLLSQWLQPTADKAAPGVADRRQHRPSGARAHVGRAGDDARGTAPASLDGRAALGGAVRRHRATTVVAAPGVLRAPLPLLGAGPLR